MDDLWGEPHFRKPPYTKSLKSMVTVTNSANRWRRFDRIGIGWNTLINLRFCLSWIQKQWRSHRQHWRFSHTSINNNIAMPTVIQTTKTERNGTWVTGQIRRNTDPQRCLIMFDPYASSSTPQGGGESFKNRKAMESCRRSGLLWFMDGRTNTLMERKVVGVMRFWMVAVVTGGTVAGCSIV